MKIAIVFSTLLTLIFLSMIGYALITKPVTQIESSITVQTPAPVVCKILRDFKSYSQWSEMMHKKSDPAKPNHFQSTYRFNSNTLNIYEFLEPARGNTTIFCKQLDSDKSGLIARVQNRIRIRTLPDGATNIDWEFSYSCLSLGALLLNPIKTRPQISLALSRHMQALQRFLDN